MKNNTCSFAGHQKLPARKIKHIIKHLDDEIEKLIQQGVTNFISGGNLGFDQIAASLVIAKMVNHSKYCICALLQNVSRTEQTVRLAQQKELIIINVAKGS